MTSSQGCTTVDTLTVSTIPIGIVYIPSAFTPNGDGINDLFVMRGYGDRAGDIGTARIGSLEGREVARSRSPYTNTWIAVGPIISGSWYNSRKWNCICVCTRTNRLGGTHRKSKCSEGIGRNV